ncbi:MAG: OmpA family protein [Smithellaceae bacterium]|nr:OmpA family protein [Smithellaceae bacterium]
MRIRNLIPFVFILLLVATPSLAGIKEGAYYVSPFVGSYRFDGDLRLDNSTVYGLRVGNNITKVLGVEGTFDYSKPEVKMAISDKESTVYGGRFDILLHLFPDGKLVPFLALGLGGIRVDYPAAAALQDRTKALFDWGGGLKLFLSDGIALRADARQMIVFDKNILANTQYTVALDFVFGGKEPPPPVVDSDGDGVPDDVDKCPDTPLGVAVDADGCPVDTDGDGVADYLDKCPDTPKGVTVDKDGCPVDSDGDGVPDYLDKCPDTPKGVKVDYLGCPIDSDGDGVPDYLDKCPDTPKDVKVDADGCPIDSDGDGVPDYLDKCPDTPKDVKVDADGCPIDSDDDGVPDYLDKCPDTPKGVKVDADGCPVDSDGDGVPDYLDKCPDTPKGVKVDKDGCPPLAVQEVVKKAEAAPVPVEQITLMIKFDYKKTNIKPIYREEIKKVADYLKRHPDQTVVIEGHTDNIGGWKYNMKLSQKRADAVKAYLVREFGVTADRIQTKGFAYGQPVASNDTEEGRSRNRRSVASFYEPTEKK